MRGYRGEMTCTGRAMARPQRAAVALQVAPAPDRRPCGLRLDGPPAGWYLGRCRLCRRGVSCGWMLCPAPGHNAAARKGGPAMAFAHAERALGDFSLAPAQTDLARGGCHDPNLWFSWAGR